MTEPQTARKLRLGAFIMATGHHIAAWRHPGSQADAGVNIDHYIELAQTAERGLFDQVFVADSPGVWHRGDRESFSRQGRLSHFEPVTLWAALSAVTKHIGFVATASTTYEDPYLLARKFASLDHISKGRAAWNVVTTSAENVHGNFGLDAHPDPALRYERAHEFVDVVKGLWDSFDDDAFTRDKATGVYFDPDKLHTLNHIGKHLKVQGPLNIERSPQGHPVIVQAGSSEDGKELAAATAEAIFTAWTSLAEAQAFYKDVKGRMAKYGRRPEEPLVLPGISPVIGRTEEEAQAKWAELQALIHPSVGLATLAPFWPGEDLSKWNLDAPPPYIPEPPKGINSRAQVVLRLAGPVDADRLRRAAAELLGTHAALRSGFVRATGGAPVAVVPDAVEVPWRRLHDADADPAELAGRAADDHGMPALGLKLTRQIGPAVFKPVLLWAGGERTQQSQL